MSPACLLLHVSCKASWWRPVFGEGGTRCATTFLQFDPVVHYFDVLQGGYIVHGFFVFIQLFIVQFCDFHFHFFCIFGVCTGSIFFLSKAPVFHYSVLCVLCQWNCIFCLLLSVVQFSHVALRASPLPILLGRSLWLGSRFSSGIEMA